MHLHQLITVGLPILKLASGRPAPHDILQQPLIHTTDNFTLTPIRDALVSNKVIGDVLDDFEPQYYLDVFYPDSGARVSLGNEIEVEAVKNRPTIAVYQVPAHNQPPSIPREVTFTLVLTDPDAKSRYDPKWSEMCHWIATNITFPAGALESGVHLELDPFEIINDIDNDDDNDDDLDSLKHKKKKKKNKKHKKKKKHPKIPSKCQDDEKGGKCLPGELESYAPPGPPPKTGWHRYVFVLLEGDTTRLKPPAGRKHWGFGKNRHGIRQWAAEYGLTVVSANFFFAEDEKQ